MFKKNEILETLSKIALIMLFFVLLMFLSLGIDLDFSRLLEPKYWASIGAQLFFVMVTFNTVATSHSRTRARNIKGRFYIAYQTNRLRVREIEDNRLYDALSEAVENANKELYKQKCLSKIHKVSTKIGYQDIIDNYDSFDEYLEKCKIKGRSAKKLKVIAEKVVAGKYHYRKIKDNMFLCDKELNKTEENLITFSVVKNKFFGNSIKVVAYLFFSTLTQILVYRFVMVNFWSWFISNITLFVGAIVSGFQEANREIRLLTAMYEERNSFLKR